MFALVSYLLYAVYALFIVLALSHVRRPHRGRVRARLRRSPGGWPAALTYASYNMIGAVVVLPVVRHLTSRRDAIVAG